MKKKWFARFRIAALIILIALFACGCAEDSTQLRKKNNATPAENAESSPTPTSSITPVPPRPAGNADHSAALKLLPALSETEFTACNLYSAGNYVLVQSSTYDSLPESQKGHFYNSLQLMDLDHPDTPARLTFPEGVSVEPMVLPDGTVYAWDRKSSEIICYDRELRETFRFACAGTCIGCSEDGLLWFCDTERNVLAAMNPDGTKRAEQPYDPADYLYIYCGMESQRYVFVALSEDGSTRVSFRIDGNSCVDPERRGLPVKSDQFLLGRQGDYAFYNPGFRNYQKLYTSFLPEETYVVFVPEYDSTMVEDYRSGCAAMYSQCCHYDEEGVSVVDSEAVSVVNLADGTGVRLENPDDFRLYKSVFAGESQLLLAVFQKRQGIRFYLWDYGSEPSYPEHVFHRSEAVGTKAEEVAETAERICVQFGVNLYYKSEDMPLFRFGMRLSPAQDEDHLLEMMDALYAVLAEYPPGFFEEVTTNRQGIHYYLCESLENWFESGPSDVDGITNNYLGSTHIALDYSWDFDYFRTKLVHEMMHAMDARLEAYGEESGINVLDYWRNELNCEEYGFYDSYYDSHGQRIYDTRGTYKSYSKKDDIWFTDMYARTYPTEDRARIMEALMEYPEGMLTEYLSCPHLRAKAECLCAMIRAAFPSIAACREPVRWERALGIINEHPWEQ